MKTENRKQENKAETKKDVLVNKVKNKVKTNQKKEEPVKEKIVKYSKNQSMVDSVKFLSKRKTGFTFLEFCDRANKFRTGKNLPVNHKAFDLYKYSIMALISFGFLVQDKESPVSPKSKAKFFCTDLYYSSLKKEKPAAKKAA